MTLARLLRHNWCHNLLDKNGVTGFANVHADECRRKLSQLGPRAKKVPRHDREFRPSTSNRSGLRHAS